MRITSSRIALWAFLGLAISLTMSCKKDSPSPASGSNNTGTGTGGGTGGTTDPNARFFRAKIQSDSINYTEGKSGFIAYTGAPRTTITPKNWIIYEADIFPPTGVINNIFLSLGNIYLSGSTQATGSQFYGLYSEGSFAYSTTSEPMIFSGVMLEWIDKNGDRWNTSLGDQTSSTFNVTSVTNIPAAAFTEEQVTIEANFNCIFYNTSNSVISKAAKNGALKMTFRNM